MSLASLANRPCKHKEQEAEALWRQENIKSSHILLLLFGFTADISEISLLVGILSKASGFVYSSKIPWVSPQSLIQILGE